MADFNKIIMEKSQGNAKFNPDEQRKFLETFEERVIGYCSIADANSSIMKQHFKEIVANITESYQPVAVKISPEVESSYQVFYLKTAKELSCEATIVSAFCQSSPFGLVIHSNYPVDVEEKDLNKQFTDVLNPVKNKKSADKKTSFWKKCLNR
ncbi:DUF1694 domain-containing protein [Streptococcus cristatus]|uniref:DUF1694 domain-containing protein n=1 Tax=Streptococcus cristatus TaxID=45634 RepID=UPI00228468B6|nr:DUF1694 domain-containing protein [Streptococcus cristatus]MCY7217823.1 DUF1694 domain-containing protein [Streptococcus cristatus]